jgi:hypothetical protein
VDGWWAKEGGGVGRVIFRDGSLRTFLEFKGDIPQASNAQRIEFTFLVRLHANTRSLDAFVRLQQSRIKNFEWGELTFRNPLY